MGVIDLSAPTEPGHHWSCCCCPFTTNSMALAMQHCEERSGSHPAAEHLLHELPQGWRTRNDARRVITCRDGDGRALNARVYASLGRTYLRKAA